MNEPDLFPGEAMTGYAPFVDLVRRWGVDPRPLAGDPAEVMRLLHARCADVGGEAILGAAAVFLGNTIVSRHPRAAWRAAEEPTVGTDAWVFPLEHTVRVLTTEPEHLHGFLDRLPGLDQLDRVHDLARAALDAAGRAVEEAVLAEPPPIDVRIGLSAAATVTGLITRLEREYDIDVRREQDADGRETVDLLPAHGAPIRITLLPGGLVEVRAGLLLGTDQDRRIPIKEDASAARVAQTIAAVVAGGLAEVAPIEPRTGAYLLRLPQGGSTGSSGLDIAPDTVASVEELAALEGRAWPPWPRR